MLDRADERTRQPLQVVTTPGESIGGHALLRGALLGDRRGLLAHDLGMAEGDRTGPRQDLGLIDPDTQVITHQLHERGGAAPLRIMAGGQRSSLAHDHV